MRYSHRGTVTLVDHLGSGTRNRIAEKISNQQGADHVWFPMLAQGVQTGRLVQNKNTAGECGFDAQVAETQVLRALCFRHATDEVSVAVGIAKKITHTKRLSYFSFAAAVSYRFTCR
jgi:hypothetical protein